VRRHWERSGITRWDFGDLPETIVSDQAARSHWVAYPALEPGAKGADLKLFARSDQASAVHPKGVVALFAVHFAKDLKFLKRSLALPEEVQPAVRYFGGARRLEDAMADRVLQDLFAVPIRTQREFAARAAAGASQIQAAGRRLFYALLPVLAAYAAARCEVSALPDGKGAFSALRGQLEEDLDHLLPPTFIALYGAERLFHIERYLQALAMRARRALVAPDKDRAKSGGLQAYSNKLRLLLKTLTPASTVEKRCALEELFWLIEEYKVSIFAQELKTAVPVSPKRLGEKIAEIERRV
jgi:ATP-dependent helicase HrpA